MNQQDYRAQYEQLSDDELLAIASDRQDLIAEAAAALDVEIQKRGTVFEKARWLREPGSDECVHSLHDYDRYVKLSAKYKFMNRYWYVLAMAPFFVGVVLATTLFKNSQLLGAAIVGASLLWSLVCISDGLLTVIRWAWFKCPQCGHRFGTDAECWSCGFPRNPKQEVQPPGGRL